jgi:hypothetical protein
MVLTGIREQVTSNQLPVTSYQLPVAGCREIQFQVTGFRNRLLMFKPIALCTFTKPLFCLKAVP